jgi:hypothetical protein
LVHNVSGWGQQEFEILKQGAIEEYILNVIQFDCMFLTPSEFIDFMTESFQMTSPSLSCNNVKCAETTSHLQAFKSIQKKMRLMANELCKHVIIHLGHQVSVKYLPSQLAAASLHFAKNIIFKQEFKSKLGLDQKETLNIMSEYLDESMRIIGYDIHNNDQGIKELISEIHKN